MPRFSLSLDQLTDLVGGRADVLSTAERTLDWRPQYPPWARDYPFQTRQRPATAGGVVVDGRTLRGTPVR
jgi:hypothetical protein